MLGRLKVEHEHCQRPLHPGKRPAQHHEPRAGKPGRPLEIHLAQPFADLEMLSGLEIKLPGRPPFPKRDIVILVGTVGNIVGQNVGQAFQNRFQPYSDLLGVNLDRGQTVLQPLHFVDQGGCILTLALGLADLLRGRIAARLHGLHLGQQAAMLLVQRKDLGRLRLDAPTLERRVELVWVVADGLEVVHRLFRYPDAPALLDISGQARARRSHRQPVTLPARCHRDIGQRRRRSATFSGVFVFVLARCCERVEFSFPFCPLLLHHTGKNDGDFIEQNNRDAQAQLADDVRWR